MAHLHSLPSISGSKPPYVAEVPIGQLLVIAAAQRDLDGKRARTIGDNWIPELVSTLVVHDNGNGTFSIIDGQHRKTGAGIAGVPTLPCVVLTGLTLQQQAVLFLAHQRERKNVSAISEYKVSLTAEEPWAQAVRDVLDSHDLTVVRVKGKHHIAAVRSLKKTFELGGVDLLSRVVSTVKAAYGTGKIRKSWSGDIVYGVAKFYHKNPTADVARTVSTLQSQAPVAWDQDIAVWSKGAGGSEGRPGHMASLLARTYNKGLRTASKKVAE